jgi:GT2 family glycosyltransferase
MKNNTCVIIPNWNGMPFILDCLESLEGQDHIHDVIVVDNGSSDNSIETIENKYKNSILIKLPKNTGFTGGVNAGISYAIDKDYEYCALLNNDAVVDRNWLSGLVHSLKNNPDVGIATCKLLSSDGKFFDSSGDFLTVRGISFPRDRNIKDIGQRDEVEFVFGASGGASLYRVEMLKQIGLFDEFFFAYFEDVDISFRAQLAGWKIIYYPESVAYHAISKTSSRHGNFGRYHSVKNIPILYLKNMPAKLYWKYLPIHLYMLLRQLASSTLKGHLLLHLRALSTAFIHIPKALVDRRAIQKDKKLSSSQIDKLLIKGRPPKIPNI